MQMRKFMTSAVVRSGDPGGVPGSVSQFYCIMLRIPIGRGRSVGKHVNFTESYSSLKEITVKLIIVVEM